ncbi:MAG TPA: adenylosuccinate lyase [Clostridiales bacterium]|nr:adenylosuccinate lyase [Clostridiales bacterium]
MNHEQYDHPLITRYAGKEMIRLFSPDTKFSTWRRLWLALAEAQMELGLPIQADQVEEMRAHVTDINYEDAERKEKEIRHDVMAHVFAYGLQCPKAKPIIHLGATSAYVGDNGDLIVLRQALRLIRIRLVQVMDRLAAFAAEYRNEPTLGYTHFQAAQLTTVGKRAALWLQDFYLDFLEIDRLEKTIPMRGAKGTTGTQASFLELFEGDHDKVKRLDELVCEKMDFQRSMPLTGQTYSRKIDFSVLAALSGIGQSVSKMTNDLRLLAHLKEIEEPFEKQQVGSSAMAYKRNPMRSERAASIARYVMCLSDNGAFTAGSQWFERTLDDSANRRMVLPEAFLGIDACLGICTNISGGLVVHPKVIRRHIREEMPFMATENILMEAVKKGGDRQDLHEKIRVLSRKAAGRVKEEGKENELLADIADDPAFGLDADALEALLDPDKYTGRAAEQTLEFIDTYLKEIFADYKDVLNETVELNV